MKQKRAVYKTTITVLYIAAGIFFATGMYMYIFGIEALKGAIPVAGNKGAMPGVLNGKSVIILALVTALYASILNYKRIHFKDNQL